MIATFILVEDVSGLSAIFDVLTLAWPSLWRRFRKDCRQS